MYELIESTSTMFCVYPDDVSKEPKHFGELLVMITRTFFCVTDWINYCIIAKHVMDPIQLLQKY
jgi:hypothetical protein